MERNHNLELNNNLKSIRAEKGMTQTDLANRVGVSRNTISSIETEQFNPTAKLALILCIALDKKFEEVYHRRGFVGWNDACVLYFQSAFGSTERIYDEEIRL